MVTRYLNRHTNPPVFISAGVLAIGFVLWGVIGPSSLATVAEAVNGFITSNFEWLYIFGASFFLIFVIVVMFSRFGTLRLGPPDSKPEFSNLAWFAMLFTAGMGIGLVFYAVSEPITHFFGPPGGGGGTAEAARDAMLYTFYHWGVHPWAIYIVVGLSLGFFAFRKGLPLRPAAALYPLIGNRIYGWIGNLVDVLAVFGTLFGLATSLGIGGQQVGAGLEELFGIENTPTLQVILILAITAVAVVSVMLGIDKGIRNLSLINLWLAFALMVFVFVFGPTRDLLNTLASNVGTYVQNLPSLSFETFPSNPASPSPGNPDRTAQDFQSAWTLFYWGWWISWSPFVGMFIARISRGRTIRGFTAGALFAPVGASFVWLTVFGNAALDKLLATPGGPQNNPLADASAETAMFELLKQLPVAGVLATVASVVAIIVVVLFFATSSDSGSLVVDILTNGGDPNPNKYQRLFWAVIEGVIAAVLLGAGAASGADALGALQTASIVAGLPFCIVLIAMCVGLARGLSNERQFITRPREPSPLVDLHVLSARPRARSGTAGEDSATGGSDDVNRGEDETAGRSHSDGE